MLSESFLLSIFFLKIDIPLLCRFIAVWVLTLSSLATTHQEGFFSSLEYQCTLIADCSTINISTCIQLLFNIFIQSQFFAGKTFEWLVTSSTFITSSLARTHHSSITLTANHLSAFFMFDMWEYPVLRNPLGLPFVTTFKGLLTRSQIPGVLGRAYSLSYKYSSLGCRSFPCSTCVRLSSHTINPPWVRFYPYLFRPRPA